MQRAIFLGAALASSANPAIAVTDITLFAVSDTHFGNTTPSSELNRKAMPDMLNSLPGKTYPASVGGGVVATPKGVLVPGDLVDRRHDQKLWDAYTSDYGVKGEGRVKFPVHDGLGNHDYMGTESLVVTALRARNKARAGITNLDPTNMHYSWDWDNVHFVMLNLYTGDVAERFDPFKSYSFLEQDLAKNVGKSGRPVLIMQHFPIPASPFWTNAEILKLAVLLKKYNTLGILHGHSHSAKFYKYDGIDVWDDGSVMNGDQLVFRITDTKMFVVNRKGDAWGNLVFQKNITMGTPVGVQPSAAADRGDFRFSVEGVGEVHARNGRASRVEIATLRGRVVRALPVDGPTLTWDRRDAGGRALPPGIYLVRIRHERGWASVKVAW